MVAAQQVSASAGWQRSKAKNERNEVLETMTIFGEPPRYKTFLLTMWEERNLEQRQSIVWRFGLADPQTGQRRAFASLETLFTAIRQLMDDLGAEEGSD